MTNRMREPFIKQSCEISVIIFSLVIWDWKLRELKLFAPDHRHHKEWLSDKISSISDSIGQWFSSVVSGPTAAVELWNC